jgi:hypothetical protein
MLERLDFLHSQNVREEVTATVFDFQVGRSTRNQTACDIFHYVLR